MLNSDNKKIRVYSSSELYESGTKAIFENVKITFRRPAIFVGNGNGTPILCCCALFSDMNNPLARNIINDNTKTISVIKNDDGTANVTISPVNQWGRYNLIVF